MMIEEGNNPPESPSKATSPPSSPGKMAMTKKNEEPPKKEEKVVAPLSQVSSQAHAFFDLILTFFPPLRSFPMPNLWIIF